MFSLDQDNNIHNGRIKETESKNKVTDDRDNQNVAHFANCMLGAYDEEISPRQFNLVAPSENAKKVSKVVENSGIDKEKEAQKRLIESVKLKAKENSLEVIKNIKNFGIDATTDEGQRGLFEIAKIAAEQNGFVVTINIENFEINKETPEGQKRLIEIAKVVACQNGFAVAANIENFGINVGTEEGQKGLIEVAKIIAENEPSAITSHIQNFKINAKSDVGLNGLIEIAKIAAASDGFCTSSDIHKFGINCETEEGRKGLIEIAMIITRTNGRALLAYINNFGFKNETAEDQRVLINIFKNAAAHVDFLEEEYFINFGINKKTPEGQKFLIEIAKFVASENGFYLSKTIQLYGIDAETEAGKKAIIKIAKIAAAQNGGAVVENIQNFGIDVMTEEGQKEIIKIIKIAAKANPFEISRNINNFKIAEETEEGQKALIEIAMIIAQQSGLSITENIYRFGINRETSEGQRALIEIAKIAAKQNGYAISANIKYFGIDTSTEEGQKGLIEIAKISASQSGLATIRFLKNYGIDETKEEGQKALIEIAKLAVRNNLRAFNDLFEKIESSTLKLELTYYALSNILKEALSGEKLNLHHSPCYEILRALSPEENSDLRNVPLEDFKNFVQDVKGLVNERWPSNKPILDILKQIAELQKPEKMTSQEHRVIQMQQLGFVLMALADCFSLEKSKTIEQFLPIISAALKLRDPKMREDIWDLLFKNNLSFTPALKTPVHAILPALILNYLLGDAGQEISMGVQLLRDKSKNIIFKDANYNKLLLKTLLELYEETDLEKLQKKELLVKALSFKIDGKVSDKDKINKALQLIKGIISFGAAADLKDSIETFEFIEKLNQIYLEAFRKVVPIKHNNINFADQFESWQSKLRMPNAILVYASNLKKLKGQDKAIVLKALATGFEESLEGTFTTNRYSGSSHLEAAFAERETLKEEWMKGEKLPLIPMLGSDTKDKETDYRKHLLTLYEHLDKETFYPDLYLFLQTQEPAIQMRLNEQLKLADKEEKKSIKLQMKLIELAKAKGNEKELLSDIIDSYLPKPEEPTYSVQFDADIKGLYSALLDKEKKNKNYSDWTIEDTDNFEDLLLAGTEIEGSCQNINGNPEYNKCLLGYVLDGKNRLLAIKDATGKTRARAILRMLLKSNEPVLLIERIYPKILSNELETALENFALHRSDSLKLDLLSKEVGKKQSDSLETLTSLSSRAPYEYVDSQDGIHKEGKFSINKAYYLNRK